MTLAPTLPILVILPDFEFKNSQSAGVVFIAALERAGTDTPGGGKLGALQARAGVAR